MTDVLVLCYHAVSPGWPAPLAVTPERFERQLRTLVDRGFEAVTFTRSVTDPPAARTVSITFDDAYRSVFEHARPILRKLGMTATVFAPTRHVAEGGPMSWPGIDQWLEGEHREELRPMSWEELGQLAQEGWEIGSHTCTHPRLPSLEPDRLRHELEDSRAECKEATSSACRSLAYPYGDCDAAVIDATRRAGYTAAGAMIGRTRSGGLLEWPRLGIYRNDDDRRFAAKISSVSRRVRNSRAWRMRVQLRARRRA